MASLPSWIKKRLVYPPSYWKNWRASNLDPIDVVDILGYKAKLPEWMRLDHLISGDLPCSHPLHLLLEEVVSEYNKKFPEAPLEMPRSIRLQRDFLLVNINASYNAFDDTIGISPAMAKYPRPLLKAVLAHELGHKHAAEYVGKYDLYFDTAVFAQENNPVIGSLASHGPNSARYNQMIKDMLYYASDRIKYTESIKILGMQIPIPDWIADPRGRRLIPLTFDDWVSQQKYEGRGDLLTDVTLNEFAKLWEPMRLAAKEFRKSESLLRQQEELIADHVSAQIYGGRSIALALTRNQELQRAEAEIPEDQKDHPAIDFRVAAVGCAIKISTGDIQEVTDCSTAVPPPPTIERKPALER